MRSVVRIIEMDVSRASAENEREKCGREVIMLKIRKPIIQ
jgi:hypothetical protein